MYECEEQRININTQEVSFAKHEEKFCSYHLSMWYIRALFGITTIFGRNKVFTFF